MKNFSVEISADNEGESVELTTDNMNMRVYQKINNEMVQIFEVVCCVGLSGPMSTAEFVGRKKYPEITTKAIQKSKLTIYSDK